MDVPNGIGRMPKRRGLCRGPLFYFKKINLKLISKLLLIQINIIKNSRMDISLLNFLNWPMPFSNPSVVAIHSLLFLELDFFNFL